MRHLYRFDLHPPTPVAARARELRAEEGVSHVNLVYEAALLAACIHAPSEPTRVLWTDEVSTLTYTPPVYFLRRGAYGVAYFCKIYFYGNIDYMAAYGLLFCEPTARWILRRMPHGIADLALAVYKRAVEVSPCLRTCPPSEPTVSSPRLPETREKMAEARRRWWAAKRA